MYTNEPWRTGVLLPWHRTAPRRPTARPADDADRDTSV
jgi:hypothetical protein